MGRKKGETEELPQVEGISSGGEQGVLDELSHDLRLKGRNTVMI